MPQTRVRTQDLGDGQVQTADLAPSAVNYSKLLLASACGLEDAGSGAIRVKVNNSPVALDAGTGALRLRLASGGGLAVDGSGNLYGSGLRVVVSDPASPAEGETWLNSTVAALRARSGGISGGLGRQVYASLADSNTIANTTAETFFDPQFSIPALWLSAGKSIRLRAWGELSTTGTPSLRPKAYLGAAIHTGPNMTQGNSVSSYSWHLDVEWIIRAAGASGALSGQMVYRCQSGAGGVLSEMMGGAQQFGADLSADCLVRLSMTWSAANAANQVKLKGLRAELWDS